MASVPARVRRVGPRHPADRRRALFRMVATGNVAGGCSTMPRSPPSPKAPLGNPLSNNLIFLNPETQHASTSNPSHARDSIGLSSSNRRHPQLRHTDSTISARCNAYLRQLYRRKHLPNTVSNNRRTRLPAESKRNQLLYCSPCREIVGPATLSICVTSWLPTCS